MPAHARRPRLVIESMCGITAILGEGRDSPTGGGSSASAIDRMTTCLTHRGPDASDTVRRAGCALGHTRLSIIDLAGGHQPMTDETGRFWIVFNGEIFNYRELRKTLEQLGWRFRTQSDTEVLLCAYQQYGEQCPRHL